MKPSFIKKHKTFSCSVEHARLAQSTRMWSTNDDRFITKHRLTDMTLRELAEHFDVSIGCVVRRVKFLGLPPIPKDLRTKRTADALRHSEEKLIKRLQDLYASGHPINAQALQRSNLPGIGGLYVTGAKTFGTYQNFLNVAGFNPTEHDLYFHRKVNKSLDDIIEAMRKANHAGKDLHHASVRDNAGDLGWIHNALNRLPKCDYGQAYELAFPERDYNTFKRNGLAGKRTSGIDGWSYPSACEADVGNTLYQMLIDKKILEYIRQVKLRKYLPTNRPWTCDFVITMPTYKILWVEVDGFGDSRQNPNIFAEKINFYKTQRVSYIIIGYKERYKTENIIQDFFN